MISSFEQMFEHEAELPESERMEFVVIATPTCTHFAIALLALEVMIIFIINTSRMVFMLCVKVLSVSMKMKLLNSIL